MILGLFCTSFFVQINAEIAENENHTRSFQEDKKEKRL